MSEAEEKTDASAENADAGAEPGIRTAVTREGSCECVIRVQADAEHLKQRYQERLAAFQREAQVPGFRVGRAPLPLLERRFGKKIKQEVIATVASEGYDEAVEQNDLKVVSDLESPDPEELQWEVGEPLELEFRCEVMPAVELQDSQYKGLTVRVPRVEVTEEMLQQELERFVRQLASWEPVKTAGIDRDDYVEAEVCVATEGDQQSPWRQKLGFYPRDEQLGPFAAKGIKAALMDAKAGDTIQVDAELPEQDELRDSALEQLAGEPLKLNVAIQAVYRQRVPELDDELARKLGLESTEQIRSIVRERLEQRLERFKRDSRRAAVVEALLNNVPVEMPPTLVARATAEHQRRLMIRGLRAGLSREQVEEMARKNLQRSAEEAVRTLKAGFLLQQIADRERIYVTDAEVREQMEALAASQGWPERRARRFLEDAELAQSLRREMREERTIEFLLQSARVEEVNPEPSQQPAGAESQQADSAGP